MARWVGQRAATAGARLALNLQSANLLRFNQYARETFTALLQYATYVFGNANEIEVIKTLPVGLSAAVSISGRLIPLLILSARRLRSFLAGPCPSVKIEPARCSCGRADWCPRSGRMGWWLSPRAISL